MGKKIGSVIYAHRYAKRKNIPIIPKPYYNEEFYTEATYGNERLINDYFMEKIFSQTNFLKVNLMPL